MHPTENRAAGWSKEYVLGVFAADRTTSITFPDGRLKLAFRHKDYPILERVQYVLGGSIKYSSASGNVIFRLTYWDQDAMAAIRKLLPTLSRQDIPLIHTQELERALEWEAAQQA